MTLTGDSFCRIAVRVDPSYPKRDPADERALTHPRHEITGTDGLDADGSAPRLI
jgi:hypothetical protein